MPGWLTKACGRWTIPSMPIGQERPGGLREPGTGGVGSGAVGHGSLRTQQNMSSRPAVDQAHETEGCKRSGTRIGH